MLQNITLGQRIKWLRANNCYNKKISQEELARMLDCSVSRVKRMERDKCCSFTEMDICTLCQYFKVDEVFLFRGLNTYESVPDDIQRVVNKAEENPLYRYYVTHLVDWTDAMLEGALNVISGLEARMTSLLSRPPGKDS